MLYWNGTIVAVELEVFRRETNGMGKGMQLKLKGMIARSIEEIGAVRAVCGLKCELIWINGG